jgi:hypothetical protein
MSSAGKKQRTTTKRLQIWTPNSKQIALAILLLDPEDRRTKREKFKEIGVQPKTAYRWLSDERYVSYINTQLDKFVNAELVDVYRALLMQCKRGNVPALRLFFELKDLFPSKDKW